MGTLIPPRIMLKQWRSVIIAVSGMLVAVLLILAVVAPLFGFETFVAGSGPLAGGIVATSLTTEGLTAAGAASSIIVLPALVLMLQSAAVDAADELPPAPVRDEAARQRRTPRTRPRPPRGGGSGGDEEEARHPAGLPRRQSALHALPRPRRRYGRDPARNPHPHPVLDPRAHPRHPRHRDRALPDKAMERSNSFGIAMAGVIAIVMAPLVAASVDDVIRAFLPTIAILIVGGAGIVIGGFIATKRSDGKAPLGMSVALTAMYGFPADYLLTNEVARSIARDDDEKEALLNVMLPPMLVGGFTSVSAGSVVIASILVSLL